MKALCDLEYRAQTEADTMDYQFARRLVNAVLEGWREPYVVACYYTYGLHPVKLIPALAARRNLQRWELYRVDYGEKGHPEAGTGNVYRMPPQQAVNTAPKKALRR